MPREASQCTHHSELKPQLRIFDVNPALTPKAHQQFSNLQRIPISKKIIVPDSHS